MFILFPPLPVKYSTRPGPFPPLNSTTACRGRKAYENLFVPRSKIEIPPSDRKTKQFRLVKEKLLRADGVAGLKFPARRVPNVWRFIFRQTETVENAISVTYGRYKKNIQKKIRYKRPRVYFL